MEELLQQMEARAQRQLDGMSVNRDLMARDVLALVRAVRRAREASAKQAATNSKTAGIPDSPFAGIFDEIWKGRK